jgi:GDP-L-fucose synthase
MELDSRILVTGAAGMAGSAVVRELKQLGYLYVRGLDYVPSPNMACVDLTDQCQVDLFFKYNRFDYVFHIAAKVGGIQANIDQGGLFIYENLMMQTNVIESARKYGIKKLIFCGSACIYPKYSNNPINETNLLGGHLEETNKPYAVAKIAGVSMCQAYRKQYGCNFISAMPTNLYGEGDNFHLTDSHVMPALIRRFHEAKINELPEVLIWGTGKPKREFLYIEDLAKALIFLMLNYNDSEPINVGTGSDIEISQLVNYIKNIVGFEGSVHYSPDKPDGVLKRSLDVTKINKLGWAAQTPLYAGIEKTYKWFAENYVKTRK